MFCYALLCFDNHPFVYMVTLLIGKMWLQPKMERCVCNKKYRKVSNIRRTKSQYSNDSHLVLQSSLPNPLKPGVKLRMKM